MPFNDLLLANHNLRSGPQDIAAPHQLNSQNSSKLAFSAVIETLEVIISFRKATGKGR